MLVHSIKLKFKVFYNLQSELVPHTADLSGSTELKIIDPVSSTRPTARALFETADPTESEASDNETWVTESEDRSQNKSSDR